MRFHYVVTVVLNHEKITERPEKIAKITPCVGQYNWNKVNFPTSSIDWKRFETSNKTVTLNVFFLTSNGRLEKIR